MTVVVARAAHRCARAPRRPRRKRAVREVVVLRRSLAAAHALIRETCDATEACFATAVKGAL